jgi:hypothetical protein
MTRYLPSVPLQPAPAPITHDVTIVTTRKSAQARVMGVPPEEFEIERGVRSIRDCNYCFHEVVTKTEAQLIAERVGKERADAMDYYLGHMHKNMPAQDGRSRTVSTDVADRPYRQTLAFRPYQM